MNKNELIAMALTLAVAVLCLGVFLNILSAAAQHEITVTAEVRNPYDPVSTVEAPQQSMTVEHQSDLLYLELR